MPRRLLLPGSGDRAIVPSKEALYVGDLLEGPHKSGVSIERQKRKRRFRSTISSVQEMLALEDESLLFRDMSYTQPAAWFHCANGKTETSKTALETRRQSRSPILK